MIKQYIILSMTNLSSYIPPFLDQGVKITYKIGGCVWRYLRTRWYKLNFDRAYRENLGSRSIGFFLHKSDGVEVASLAKPIG